MAQKRKAAKAPIDSKDLRSLKVGDPVVILDWDFRTDAPVPRIGRVTKVGRTLMSVRTSPKATWEDSYKITNGASHGAIWSRCIKTVEAFREEQLQKRREEAVIHFVSASSENVKDIYTYLLAAGKIDPVQDEVPDLIDRSGWK